MENTWFLEVEIGDYQPTTQRFTYLSYEAAKAQLDLIEPKLLGAELKYKNDPDAVKHRIVSEDGDAIVMLHLVRSVRAIDRSRFQELSEYARRTERDDHAHLLANAIDIALKVAAREKIDAPDDTQR